MNFHHHDSPVWATTNTWDTPDWSVDELIAAKRGRTVSVVLPALNEENTVADVVASIRPLVGTLVDELIVLDSGSTDATAERALAAGAEVISREQAVPELDPLPGKGEVLWRSLAVTSGDVIAFVDSDLIDPDPAFVPKLLGPLLLVDGMHLVKAYYRRPLRPSTVPRICRLITPRSARGRLRWVRTPRFTWPIADRPRRS